MGKELDERQLNYLSKRIKKKVDLSEFLEVELGCRLNWTEANIHAKCHCPMPHHADDNASFHVTFFEDSDVWAFNCFGCGLAGTIVDFYSDFYEIDRDEAIIRICEKFGFKSGEELQLSSINDVERKVNQKKKMECSHIVASNLCRMLLNRDYEKYGSWVASAYREMNKSLDEGDLFAIEAMEAKVYNKMEEDEEC